MPQFKISSGLPSYPEGLKDADASLVSPLYRSLSALGEQLSTLTGNIEYTPAERGQVDPLGLVTIGNYTQMIVQAFEDLIYGSMVHIFLDAGVIKARKAQAAVPNYQAHGVVNIPEGITTGSRNTIILLQGRTKGIAGTTIGTSYYLSTVPGAVQTPAPTGSGILQQPVGIGLGSEGFLMNIHTL